MPSISNQQHLLRPDLRRATLVLLAVALGACSDKGDDTGSPGLPDETGQPYTLDSAPLDFDTATGGLTDDIPDHTLVISQLGTWDLTPRGGPWTAMTGELTVLEILDGDEELPACELHFALTGEGDGQGCDTCDAGFQVSFFLTEGDLEACHDPDLPAEGEIRGMALSEDEGSVYFDYYGSGIWLPWYDAEVDEDHVDLSFQAELAITVEEEEE